ncbi:hypothetical protein [Sphingobium nicotianae]|uniref:DUF2336 domain-containing protein n=1 Tax=Sphingobium nicotianae TaxID=2782607 RepID=A0A9X1AIE0_9SPHN|nr:hypothetical protein [Sphingobium nicotianae]MBT2185827.1 hypothetical protein [Sphingobium nicotianae]
MNVGNEPAQQRAPGGGGGEGGRPGVRLFRRLIEDVRHGADLAQLADSAPRRWSDALLAETRFHLAGMMNAVELAIGLHVSDARVESMLAELGPGYARHAIEEELEILSPELLGHLRRRAAVAMLLRQNDGSGAPVSIAAVDPGAGNDRYLDALAALGIAERRWSAPMLLDAPMRPDLPAEHFHDLAWTVAALLIRGCEADAAAGDQGLFRALVQATERLIARHDEGRGAFALAQLCARSLTRASRLALAPAALVDARLLLFAALAEGEIGLSIEQVIEALIDPLDEPRHAVLRLMNIDDAVAFRTMELLAPLTGAAARGDIGLAEFVEDYRLFDAAKAVAWLMRVSSPPALVEKLALMERAQ